MNPVDFVHLALLAVGGEIKGSTKLQKTIYFLGVLTDKLDDLGYRPHFYGPYSEVVADAVDQLKSLGFVDREVRGGVGVDERGFEVCRFDHRLTPDGRAVAEGDRRRHQDLWIKLENAGELLKRAPNIDYVKLSVAAKTYFMLGERRGNANLEELTNLAKKFGWSVTPQEVREAARYLEKLNLVHLCET